MVFADLWFLYIFIPCFALVYFLAYWGDRKGEKTTLRNAALILFSLLFYVWGEPVYVLLLLGGVLTSYICARTHKEILGIVVHLLLLAVFKYGNLVLATIGSAGVPVPEFSIRLPIGISFYTFQSISYLADVRRGKCKPQRSFFRLLLYISMFPQLIAGPIVRYTEVEAQIEKRSTGEDDFAKGMRRFIIGLAKKVILADQLAEVVEQTLGAELGGISCGMAWIGLLAFSLQIYYDFSGYSDMAIGMGRCMGFAFPENFDAPYMCSSVTDFWRRWHKTLGGFFRDYVYIPLGGNKVAKWKWVRNLLIVWALTGFWHGASWNFLLWGLYFGIILLIERLVYYGKTKEEQEGFVGVLRRIISLFLIVLGWGIFYFEDFGKMLSFFHILFTGSQVSGELLLRSMLSQNAFLLLAALLGCIKLPLPEKDNGGTWAVRIIWSAVLLAVSTLLLIGASTHPFLYTRF